MMKMESVSLAIGYKQIPKKTVSLIPEMVDEEIKKIKKRLGEKRGESKNVRVFQHAINTGDTSVMLIGVCNITNPAMYQAVLPDENGDLHSLCIPETAFKSLDDVVEQSVIA